MIGRWPTFVVVNEPRWRCKVCAYYDGEQGGKTYNSMKELRLHLIWHGYERVAARLDLHGPETKSWSRVMRSAVEQLIKEGRVA